MPDRSFLESQHPIYKAHRAEWRTNERRWRGGRGVLTELARFDWETADGDRYKARKAEATYINFPDLFLRTMVGHLFSQAPAMDDALDFGRLGRVTRPDGAALPSEAELVYYNADGAGQDGSSWDAYWAAVTVRSGVCGHRWMLVEASAEAPGSFADVIAGRRPYLTDFSPLSVPDWHFNEGRLEYAIIDIWERRPRVEDGKFISNAELVKYLLVRRGWEGFGEEFTAGGWWKFRAEDPDGEPLAFGDWERTGGEIPMFALFWERDDGEPAETKEGGAGAGGGKDKDAALSDGPNVSRSGIGWLGQIAVSYMNLSSAADFDAWDAAKSTKIIVGATLEGFNLMETKAKEGSMYLPLPVGPDGTVPTVYDSSSSAVASETFETRLERKRTEARDLAAMEASGTPDSSGASKRAGFADIKSPVLSRLASEVETAQNTAIHFLEQRFGYAQPTGAVTWPRDYQLKPLIEDIHEMFQLEQLAGINSPTLGGRLLIQAAKDKGLMTDASLATTVEEEYRVSAEQRREREAQAQDALGQLGMA